MPVHQEPPFSVEGLLNQQVIEGSRIEFKADFNSATEDQVLQTISAFANDLQNVNGGYLILGVEEADGRPVLPPRGLEPDRVDDLQMKLLGACRGKISPDYQPMLFPVAFQGREILVIWAPGGDNRPYQAPTRNDPRRRAYHIRVGPQTVEARDDQLRQLLEQTAKIPFDDRRNLKARLEDISPTLVRRFLADVRSELVTSGQMVDEVELYRRLRLLAPVNAHSVPRNVALLLFHEDPDREFFPGARIEVVQFGDDAGGDLIEERVFRGPLPTQIKDCLNYLDGLGGRLLEKSPGVAEVQRTVAYPYAALEEALVNAIYHRGYDGPPEPTKVYLYPDRLEITSYPGPVAGLKPAHFVDVKTMPQVPARNRRIGEFLKELRLCEARGTGIPKIRRKMEENGSPAPRFEFDDGTTYFRVILPVHPRYQILHALRESAHLWATGARAEALAHLERSLESQPGSGALLSQLIEYAFGVDNLPRAKAALRSFAEQRSRTDAGRPYLTMAGLLLGRQLEQEAQEVLRQLPPSSNYAELLDAAILRKRCRDFDGAHRLFSQAYALEKQDPKLLHEYAQTKMKLNEAQNPNLRSGRETRRRLAREASELLRSAIQLADSDQRAAWCWHDLAKVLGWQRKPVSEIEEAYRKAISLLPEEPRFAVDYAKWQEREQDRD